ncbi:MAG: hypothetical protein M3268_10455 [Acidobacteriota bacterium]|nr:hypothetical protein [Acidobacteriota bacterium]
MTSRESHALPLAAPPRDGERAEQARHSRPTTAVGAAGFEQVATGVADAFALGRGRAGASRTEINVERLTEQVSRHLARRLLVERERRGLGRK